jgi:hypothetical protein
MAMPPSLPGVRIPIVCWLREFRVRILPAVVFAAVVILIVILWRRHIVPTSVHRDAAAPAATPDGVETGRETGSCRKVIAP